jgi:Ni/Fe-hydrogenase subunit HybB-like protein
MSVPVLSSCRTSSFGLVPCLVLGVWVIGATLFSYSRFDSVLRDESVLFASIVSTGSVQQGPLFSAFTVVHIKGLKQQTNRKLSLFGWLHSTFLAVLYCFRVLDGVTLQGRFCGGNHELVLDYRGRAFVFLTLP